MIEYVGGGCGFVEVVYVQCGDVVILFLLGGDVCFYVEVWQCVEYLFVVGVILLVEVG